MKPISLRIPIDQTQAVSAILDAPADPACVYVFAHGAGAGMTHPFMQAVAGGLRERGVATLRYQFVYMERGSKAPDRPPLAHAAVRAAMLMASDLLPDIPLFAGGKSFGARMTSQALASEPVSPVRGLIFFGFPLHPAGAPSSTRAAHLADVLVPMLFLQGSKDKLAELQLLKPVVEQLGAEATLHVVDEADHSFHVPARSGRKDTAVMDELLDRALEWMKRNH